MNYLWKIKQDVNQNPDAYYEAIVVASDELEARKIFPSNIKILNSVRFNEKENIWLWNGKPYSYAVELWTNPKNVHVTKIGIADDWLNNGLVICVSRC